MITASSHVRCADVFTVRDRRHLVVGGHLDRPALGSPKRGRRIPRRTGDIEDGIAGRASSLDQGRLAVVTVCQEVAPAWDLQSDEERLMKG